MHRIVENGVPHYFNYEDIKYQLEKYTGASNVRKEEESISKVCDTANTFEEVTEAWRKSEAHKSQQFQLR